jgi:hypothetical protein
MDTVFFVILILRQLLLSCAIRKLTILKETLIKLIPFLPFGSAQESVRPIRRAHGRQTPLQGCLDHERNQQLTVRSELVEGLNQSFLKLRATVLHEAMIINRGPCPQCTAMTTRRELCQSTVEHEHELVI